MEHAAEVHHNLDKVLGPRFEIFTTGIHDLKETISDLRHTVELLRDTVVTSTSDIKAIKEKQEEQELRIVAMEASNNEHKIVAADYKRSKAICIWCAGVAITIFSTVIGCVLSDYLEGRRHAEEIKSRQALQESYNKLSAAVDSLVNGEKH